MTLDFMLGFASPFAPIVRMDPRGFWGWLFFPMARRVIASDGYILMGCLRLCGITIGATLTIACKTSATPTAAIAPPGQQSAEPQFSPEQRAAIMQAMQAQAGKVPVVPASPSRLGRTKTTASKGR
jgi:hypothetical protein